MKLYVWEELDLSVEMCPGSAFAWADSEDAAIDLICANYEQQYDSIHARALRELRKDLKRERPKEITEHYGCLVICG